MIFKGNFYRRWYKNVSILENRQLDLSDPVLMHKPCCRDQLWKNFRPEATNTSNKTTFSTSQKENDVPQIFL